MADSATYVLQELHLEWTPSRIILIFTGRRKYTISIFLTTKRNNIGILSRSSVHNWYYRVFYFYCYSLYRHNIFDPDEVIYEDTYMYGASTSASGCMIVEDAEYQGASIPIASNLTDDTDRTCVPKE